MVEIEDIESQPDGDDGALHHGVLQVTGDDWRRWTAALWSRPAQVAPIVGRLKSLVEATLALEWIQPLRSGDDRPEAFDSFDLLCFEEPPPSLARRLKALGFEAIDLAEIDDDVWQRWTVFESEASRAGHQLSGRACALYRLGVHRPQSPLAERIERVCRRSEESLAGQVWGEEPGRFSKVFCEHLFREVQTTVAPTTTGLGTLEDLLVEPGPQITWVEPVVFQMLCDFMAVVWQTHPGLEVQWSLCDVDDKSGLAPPPVLRVRHRQKPWQVVPIGRLVVSRLALGWGESSRRQLVALHDRLLKGKL